MSVPGPPRISTLHTREEVWQRFATEMGGVYISGDFWEEEKIKLTLPPWNITITLVKDNLQVATTRLSARYLCLDNFTFSILRVESHFHLEGHPSEQIEKLLGNESLRRYLASEAHIRLYNERNSQQEKELTCTIIGAVGERHRLLALFELMGETLQHLCAIGSAAEVMVPSQVKH